tara:strand:- start:1087 stop:1842 length:756 start_codon:yes stop_codon:yes gene_type:complete
VNSGNQLPLGRGVRVLKSHPSGLLALAKPSGVRSHPNDEKVDPKALLKLPYNHKMQFFEGEGIVWHLLHRLDAPTSGVILLTSSEVQAAELRQLFAERKVKKTYYAIVIGKTKTREDIWRDRLKTDHTRGERVRTERGGGATAVAAMRSLRFSVKPPVLSLLELKPETGRTHQLRIQCSQRRVPILGDATYGDFASNRRYARESGKKRLFLHAAQLQFPLEGAPEGVFKVEDPLPESFVNVLPPTEHRSSR